MMTKRTAVRTIDLNGREYRVAIEWWDNVDLLPGITFMRRKFGYSKGDWMHASFRDYWFHPDELPKLITALQEVYQEWQAATAEAE